MEAFWNRHFMSMPIVWTDKAEYQDDGEMIDAEGLLVLPGLVDIHSHGAAGEDFSDGNPEGLKKILRYERSCGITSYCPTSMTFPKERLRLVALIKGAQTEEGAKVVGINMEGPFLDPAKKGAHVEKWIAAPDVAFVRELNQDVRWQDYVLLHLLRYGRRRRIYEGNARRSTHIWTYSRL